MLVTYNFFDDIFDKWGGKNIATPLIPPRFYGDDLMNNRNLHRIIFACIILTLSGCNRTSETPGKLVLNGNIDDRQANAAFLVSERIATVNVEEGDTVKKGDLLATLETIRIENRVTEATAAVAAAEANAAAMKAAADAAQANLEKTLNGNRPEEIAMAEAGLEIINAQIKAAENLYQRNKTLSSDSGMRAVSEQELEDAESNFKKLLAEQTLAQENFKRIKDGAREEDKAAARAAAAQAKAAHEHALAAVAQAKAALAIQLQILTDSKLLAPCDGIVRNRILEPGEMASPQTPVVSLAVVSPKWVRVYLSETLLPRIKSGDKAKIRIDGLPNKSFDGWIGFISPNAEFTPKNVETPELRTSLVYEVRVYVNDPENTLKLGAPATVELE